MFERNQTIARINVGNNPTEVMELPDLVDIQLSSYERFLQRERLLRGEPIQVQGLEEV